MFHFSVQILGFQIHWGCFLHSCWKIFNGF